LLFLVLRAGDRSSLRKRLHKYSEKHRFALELRISLIALFSLSALAVATHVSIMLAGFALGLVVAMIGEPRRLARQLFGITEGFFGPLFFVWLGASLRYASWPTIPSSSSSESVSVPGRCWRTARAGCSSCRHWPRWGRPAGCRSPPPPRHPGGPARPG
jgi:hypothetical protein